MGHEQRDARAYKEGKLKVVRHSGAMVVYVTTRATGTTAMDPDDQPDDFDIPVATEPAYNVAGVVPLSPTEQPGSHCANSPEWCFLCAFESDVTAGGTEADLYGTCTQLIRRMTDEGREQACIAYHVRQLYLRDIQSLVEDAPDWPLSSIVRHLTYSSQSSDLFDASTESMLKSLIARQNANLIDATTHQVIEENRRAFIHTIDAYVRFTNATKRTPQRRKLALR